MCPDFSTPLGTGRSCLQLLYLRWRPAWFSRMPGSRRAPMSAWSVDSAHLWFTEVARILLHSSHLYPPLGREKCGLGRASKGTRMIFPGCDFYASSRERRKPKEVCFAYGAEVRAVMAF